MNQRTIDRSQISIAFCVAVFSLILGGSTAVAETCNGKAGSRLHPGAYAVQVCVPVGECVSSYDQKAYCSNAQSQCSTKGADCEESSGCYALPDADNKGVSSTVTAGRACEMIEGKTKKPGVLCTFNLSVGAKGHLDCHCQCGKTFPVPLVDARSAKERRVISLVEERDCSQEKSQKFHRSSRKTEVNFVNDTAEEIQIFGLNAQGSRVFYHAIMPHQSYAQKTYISRPLVVTDKEGVCKRLVIAGKNEGEVVLK